MTDIRARLANALQAELFCGIEISDQKANRLANVLLSLPGIAIVETEPDDHG
jgi:hypothetical protein